MNQLVRLAVMATAFSTVATAGALAQRGRGTGGTMGAPVGAQPPAAGPTAPSPSSRGTMYVPGPGPTGPRGGDLPRIGGGPTQRPTAYGYVSGFGKTYGGGSGYGTPDGVRGDRSAGGPRSDRGDGYARTDGNRPARLYTTTLTPTPYTRRAPVCGYGCVRIGGGHRAARVFATFSIGYPFYVPVYVPYIYDATYVRYGEEAVADTYAPEPYAGATRPASKLIVIGAGSAGGGDALTVETIGDSVRLSWVTSGRTPREVKLFVSDSAKRELASRSATAWAPNATFEVATLSAPVAFAGVSVTFTDGIVSTTLVPYRNGATSGQRR
jgi:hypothetical protein